LIPSRLLVAIALSTALLGACGQTPQNQPTHTRLAKPAYTISPDGKPTIDVGATKGVNLLVKLQTQAGEGLQTKGFLAKTTHDIGYIDLFLMKDRTDSYNYADDINTRANSILFPEPSLPSSDPAEPVRIPFGVISLGTTPEIKITNVPVDDIVSPNGYRVVMRAIDKEQRIIDAVGPTLEDWVISINGGFNAIPPGSPSSDHWMVTEKIVVNYTDATRNNTEAQVGTGTVQALNQFGGEITVPMNLLLIDQEAERAVVDVAIVSGGEAPSDVTITPL